MVSSVTSMVVGVLGGSRPMLITGVVIVVFSFVTPNVTRLLRFRNGASA